MSHASRKLLRKSVLVSMSFFPGTALLAQSITVVSWGGSYARASQEGYHRPFTEETGIEVLLEDYNGGLA
ncbi:MAG: ABC transporter substrate-binding protein, partial [Chloroflexi bacterium]|nr:ABC transporter substrate-binding protein [Chloroflexota bacterium]